MPRCSNAADPFKNYQAAARRRGLSLRKVPAGRMQKIVGGKFALRSQPHCYLNGKPLIDEHFDNIVGAVAAIESHPCVG